MVHDLSLLTQQLTDGSRSLKRDHSKWGTSNLPAILLVVANRTSDLTSAVDRVTINSAGIIYSMDYKEMPPIRVARANFDDSIMK
jgi:hypothetical protein